MTPGPRREELLLIDGRLVPAADDDRFENVNPAIKTIAEALKPSGEHR
jgi:hypothetical protein